jgi:hypothetical protein
MYELRNVSLDKRKEMIPNGVDKDDGWEYVAIFFEDIEKDEVLYDRELLFQDLAFLFSKHTMAEFVFVVRDTKNV